MDDYWDCSPEDRCNRQNRFCAFNEIVKLVHRGQEAIQSLIEEDPTKINEIQSNGYTWLQVAAHEGSKDLVQFLLNQGANIHVRGYNHETALHLACVRGHEDVVKMLLEGGSQVKQRDDYCGNTALHYTTQGGHKGIVELLLNQGADINVENKHDKTALHLAIEKGHDHIVKLLLKQGAAVTAKDKRITELILNSGNDINTQRYNFEESLRMARYSRQVDLTDIVKLLIERGIDVISTNGFEQCLKVACKHGYADIVKELLDRAAKSNYHETIRRIAARRSDQCSIQEWWSRGNYVDEDEDLDRTVLHLACEAGHKKVVQLLIDYGANLNAIDERGDTTLCSAVRGGNAEVFALVLNHGFKDDLANIDSKNFLLQIACRGGYEEIVKILLESYNLTGEEIRKSHGSTALFCAVEGAGNRNIVRMLLEFGADISAVNNRGKTALELAFHKGSLSTAKLLFDMGADIETIINTKAIPKRILLDKVKNFFTAVALAEGNEYLPILPVLCVHEIFNYLNNRDLISLIKVCKTIDQSDLNLWAINFPKED